MIFTLFILCQVWRPTLSNKLEFRRLLCRKETAERLRKTLLYFKSPSEKELIRKAHQTAIREFKYLIMILNNDTKIKPSDTSIQVWSTTDMETHCVEVNDLKFYVTDSSEVGLYKSDIAT